ncbi:MAG: glycosyltransferase family 39 protein [Clostridiales bacterium]|nr:glycosyltransferase family 39 protein [Clostridiales bacterium]
MNSELFTDKKYFDRVNNIILACSGILALFNLVLTVMMYYGTIENNFPVFFTYPLSLVLLFLSGIRYIRNLGQRMRENLWLIISLIAVSILYFIIHLYNYSNAPWNNNGLFDDAAWDIFVARERCFADGRFETIYWDNNIANISRELIFHYYISVLFRIFGYNLAVFNAGLIVLGWITVIFTMLCAHELKHNTAFTVLSGIALMFFPLHFTQVYMGHRYAVCLPLLMISFYFILRAFRRASYPDAAAGGVFAGLTMSSAIMGKHYIYGLLISGVIYGIRTYVRNREKIREYLSSAAAIIIGFVMSSIPLLAYIIANPARYNVREEGLTKILLERISSEGLTPVRENLDNLKYVLFSEMTWLRQFSTDHPVFTWYAVLFLIIGTVVLIRSGRYEITVLMLLPFAGCIITTCYDFRILSAAPFITLTLVTGVFFLSEKFISLLKREEYLSSPVAAILVIAMFLPDAVYLKNLADDPGSMPLLPHGSVAVSRYIQDLALGDEAPDTLMRSDEFNLGNTNDRYDLFACVRFSYAHVHAFLGGQYSRHILNLCRDFPYNQRNEDDMYRIAFKTIEDYKPGNKDLMLVYENGEQVEFLIYELINTGYVEAEWETLTVDGQEIEMCRLYIHNRDINDFKDAVALIKEEHVWN